MIKFKESLCLKCLYSFIILILLISCSNSKQSEFEIIHERFIEYYANSEIDVLQVQSLLDSMTADGTWPNIDYSDQRMSAWPVRNHLDRSVLLATAYVSNKSKFYHSNKVYSAIQKSLNHWADYDYKNPNWYNAQIAIPKKMSKALLLLDANLPDTLLQKCRPILDRSTSKMTGQNRVWINEVALMRSLLYGDSASLKNAAFEIWDEICISDDEGVQLDWSYHQHGPLLQMGNYGMSFSGSIMHWGNILRGTSYALEGEKLEIIRNFLLDGMSWTIWKNRMDLNAIGRQIMKDCQIKHGTNVLNVLSGMQQVDQNFEKEYAKRTNILQNEHIGFKPFWRSDFAIMRTSDWYASVKMSSNRVKTSEDCNLENMKGIHQSDGVLLHYINGDEYENIQALWDWNRLPGTTCDQKTDSLRPNLKNGEGKFAGVLGNTKGIAAMAYKRKQLTARKAWFFQEDAVICLGSNISGNTVGEVFTSVEQKWHKGENIVTSHGVLESGTHIIDANNWVHHGNTGYALLDKTVLNVKEVHSNWLEILPTYEDRPVKGNVFSLWINHGKSPVNQSYAYTIFPNVSAEEMKNKVTHAHTKIISNTNNVQAIENSTGVYAVFYSSAKLETSDYGLVSVSEPCILHVFGDSLSVTDPNQKLSHLTVTTSADTTQITFPDSEGEKGMQINKKRGI
ncbi:polysaccharide lyase family 8 super-sandwich domain-containing protein [uncultured Algibacter sp.]|uniref:polysaccharide lyase family 8 super-sandwich domain-containing protein n=1 Tax=uncultured Algibacter sp. TaxID=298659 RepID=UPI00260B5296|nr:polysaccharide lyase family 8 super-sandwich domain-containing protein [uncultured Algibacter sp.]